MVAEDRSASVGRLNLRFQAPTAVTEPLTQVHKSEAGANCHRSLSVPNAPVESMP
jgi:hypothetical protein